MKKEWYYVEDPHKDAYIRKLEAENARLKAENEDLQERLNETTSLLMKGEALRERTMLKAILGGAFSKKDGE